MIEGVCGVRVYDQCSSRCDDDMARGPVWNLSALFSLVCSSGPFGVGGSLECQQRIRRLSRRI